VHLHKGEFERAATWLERGLPLVQNFNFLGLFYRTASALGACYVQLGRLAEGVALLEQAVEEARKRTCIGGQAQRVGRLAEAYLATGRMENAIGAAGLALELSRQTKERGHEAWALRLLGEITSRLDPPDTQAAEDQYRQALALATELEMRPLGAHCHLGLGKLYRRTGKPQEAQEHLTTATTMYREMDMRFWVEKADGELKDLA